MTVLIAGGGIGGLTLALSLHQIGVPAKIFESVAELKPLGVGINVLPHAVRELIELGLLEELDAAGVRTRELAYFSKRGKPIWSEPRGLEAGYKWPQFSIHRGLLQQILLDAAIKRLGPENVLTSHHLHGWSQTPEGDRADFIDKASGQSAGSHDGALLIAADGIHSAVREKLYPEEGPPIWNGRILWRGITAGEAFLTGRTMIMAGHETLKFVCYPISKKSDGNGKLQINWVAERHMPPSYQWRREDYNRTARLEEFLPWFEDWKFDWLDVPGLIRNCPHAYEYPLVDRDPIPQWTFGTGLFFWITFLPLSIWAMQNNWNGLFLAEPRFRISVIFAITGLLLQAGLVLVARPRLTSLFNLLFFIVLRIVLSQTPYILHPQPSPIFGSGIPVLELFFIGVILFNLTAAYFMARWWLQKIQ